LVRFQLSKQFHHYPLFSNKKSFLISSLVYIFHSSAGGFCKRAQLEKTENNMKISGLDFLGIVYTRLSWKIRKKYYFHIIKTYNMSNKHKGPRKPWTKEEKLEVVNQFIHEGISAENLGDQYKIHPNTIYRWKGELFKYQNNAFPGNGKLLLTDQDKEIDTLKRKLRESELEKEILKKALTIFSQSDRTNMLS
jgi:transposase